LFAGQDRLEARPANERRPGFDIRVKSRRILPMSSWHHVVTNGQLLL
jgi:hypothetical protein